MTDEKLGTWSTMPIENIVLFSRRDDCLDIMVPSDLRGIVNRLERAERGDNEMFQRGFDAAIRLGAEVITPEPYKGDDPTDKLINDIADISAKSVRKLLGQYYLGYSETGIRPKPSGPELLARAVALVEKRIATIVEENGSYEPDTNVTNLPEWAETVCEELETLARDMRALGEAK